MSAKRYVVKRDGDLGWLVYDRKLRMAVYGCDQRRSCEQFARERNAYH